MSTEDDDLPVLTQVLRTGSGQVPMAMHGRAHSREYDWEAPGASLDFGVDARQDPEGEPTWPRALVIGSDPEPRDRGRIGESRDRPATDDAPSPDRADTAAGPASSQSMSASNMSVADPRRIDLRDNDVFLRTAPTDTVFADLIDEPPLVARDGARQVGDVGEATSSMMASRDVPLAFREQTSERDASFARRVRDSVLDELSSRIDTELDARIAQTLHAELETALAHLQTRLRAELAEALRDVVGRAVDDAVRRLRDAPSTDRDA